MLPMPPNTKCTQSFTNICTKIVSGLSAEHDLRPIEIYFYGLLLKTDVH